MQALGGPAAAAAVGAVCAPPSAANSSHSIHSSLPLVSNQHPHQEAATEDHEEEEDDECCCTAAEVRPIASLEDFLSRMEELSGLRRELVPLFLSLPSCSTWATEERETAGARPRRRAQRKALRAMRELLAALQAIPEDEDGFKALPMSDGSSSAEEDNCKENKFDDSKQKQLLQPLLQLQPHSKVVRRSFGYTIAELLKDIHFVLNGEDALINDYFPKLHPNFTNEVHSVVSMLQRATKSNDPQDQPIPFQCFVTDRDGTINNYCATYNSSFQSLYNAVFLSRFVLPSSSAPEHINTNDNANNVQKQQTKTKKKVIYPIIMTSAPLSGLCAVSVNPSHSMIYAGSKGREFLDLSGRLHKSFIDPRKQRLLDKLNAKLEALVALPQYEKFTMIGSGLQEKFGQTTIARQDTNRSVPVEESLAWLSTVRQVVDQVELEEAEAKAKEQCQPLSNHKSDKEKAEEEEAEGQEEAERNKTRPQDHQKNFMIEDTGLDIEIILTIEDNSNASVVRDFHKGDGLAFLCEELGLSMQRGPHLVCGDTSSDVPMLEEALRHCPRQTFAVFVTKEEALRRRVREAFFKLRREEEGEREENVVFVSEPDVLVTALNVFARL